MTGWMQRIFPRIVALAGVLALTAAALAPLYFESQSLYYKFGFEKRLLQAGKILGWIGLVLMVYQVVFTARLKGLEKWISLKRLFSLHRWSGTLIGILVLIHSLLILWADGFALFPLERRYWPEFTGLLALTLVAGIILVSLFRDAMGIGYKTWQRLHRLGTPVVILMAFVHAFFVSETFNHFLPRAGLALALMGGLALLARTYFKRYSGRLKTGGSRRK